MSLILHVCQTNRCLICQNIHVCSGHSFCVLDERRIDELRVKVGVKECLMKKLVRSRLKWASHVERREDEKLAEIRCPERGRKRRRGRLRMRWEDGFKREIWKEWEENGEQQQKIERVGDCW